MDPVKVGSMTQGTSDPAALIAEVGALEQRLEQREQALKVLNHRLLQLEGGEIFESPRSALTLERDQLAAECKRLRADSDHHRTVAIEAQVEARGLMDELERIRGTKLFRYTRPVRRLYTLFRSP